MYVFLSVGLYSMVEYFYAFIMLETLGSMQEKKHNSAWHYKTMHICYLKQSKVDTLLFYICIRVCCVAKFFWLNVLLRQV